MIRIDISKTLAKPLGAHIRPATSTTAEFSWRAELAIIGTERCVVAQEIFTGYVLVLCNLSADDFNSFPALFSDRLFRETLALCKQAKLYEKQELTRKLAQIVAPQQVQLDPEPIEDGKILKVIENLERRYLLEGQDLPRSGRQAFEFGLKFNNRKSSSDKPLKLNPAQRMANLCLNLIAELPDDSPIMPEILSEEANIVRVDFARNRK
ncbi:DUF6933 domain-containing protein [Teredinibacter turnerae]|uniref:DUF6933 domain-containing protein n=1 Tax=Teredinibacter turnerae TaxID=2426 RepID=UPI0003747C40|nr:hypothetical protein [Teredinibacter turnerae]